MLSGLRTKNKKKLEKREGEEGEEEMTGGYFYCYFYCSGGKFFGFLALEFLSQNTAYQKRTYVYIHIHIHI